MSIKLSILSILLPGLAFAQTSEDQRRESQREFDERQLRSNATVVTLPQANVPVEANDISLPAETPCFPVRTLSANGQEGFPGLVWVPGALQNYAGRCIGREGINLILRRLNARLMDEGFVTTRAAITGQDIASGELHISLVPGRIRAIRSKDDVSGLALSNAFPARPGDLLNLRDLEQGLEQLKRVPSQEADMEIVPADAAGESDIVVSLKHIKPWRVGFSLDDSGSRATGKRQVSTIFSLDSPLGLNDLLSLGVNNDADRQPRLHGTDGHNIQYSIPWGYWTFSLADTAYHYQQRIQGINQTFVSSGDTHSDELKAERVIHRDQQSKTALQLRLTQRFSRSFIDDIEILNQHRRTTSIELALIRRQYIGKAQMDISFAHREGVPWLGGQDDAPNHPRGAPTLRYRMQVLDISATAPFQIGAHPLRWNSVLHWQGTPDVLYSSDYLSIGNRYTVRGFDGETTLAAESGAYWRNDVEAPLGAIPAAVYAGIDQGWVSGPSAANVAGRHLVGAVAGLRGNSFGVGYDFFAGWAISKPETFVTAHPTAGFQISWQF